MRRAIVASLAERRSRSSRTHGAADLARPSNGGWRRPDGLAVRPAARNRRSPRADRRRIAAPAGTRRVRGPSAPGSTCRASAWSSHPRRRPRGPRPPPRPARPRAMRAQTRRTFVSTAPTGCSADRRDRGGRVTAGRRATGAARRRRGDHARDDPPRSSARPRGGRRPAGYTRGRTTRGARRPGTPRRAATSGKRSGTRGRAARPGRPGSAGHHLGDERPVRLLRQRRQA